MSAEDREGWEIALNELPTGTSSDFADEVAEAEGAGFMALMAGGQGVKVG